MQPYPSPQGRPRPRWTSCRSIVPSPQWSTGACKATVDIDPRESHLRRVFVRSPRLQSTSPHVGRTFAAALHSIAQGHDGHRAYPSNLRPQRSKRIVRGHGGHRLTSITPSPGVRTLAATPIDIAPCQAHLRCSCSQDSPRARWMSPISLTASPHPFAGSPETTIEITSYPSRFAIPDHAIAAVTTEVTRCPSHLGCNCSQVYPRPRWRSPHIPHTFAAPLRWVVRGHD